MLIDWFTVSAQLLNFLLLVWLLKRFLYQPILHAIDQREQRIASQLADAASKQADAQREREDFQHRNEALEQQRARLLNEATEAANAERQRLLAAARSAAETLSRQRREALRNDLDQLQQSIAEQTRQEVFAIVHKVLRDLASTSLEAQLTEVFIRRLQALDDTARAELIEALGSTTDAVRIRSVVPLPAAQQQLIEQILKDLCPVAREVRFETAPAVISGIELSANGWKLAWSITDYLASMEGRVSELLKAPSSAATRTSSRAAP